MDASALLWEGAGDSAQSHQSLGAPATWHVRAAPNCSEQAGASIPTWSTFHKAQEIVCIILCIHRSNFPLALVPTNLPGRGEQRFQRPALTFPAAPSISHFTDIISLLTPFPPRTSDKWHLIIRNKKPLPLLSLGKHSIRVQILAHRKEK